MSNGINNVVIAGNLTRDAECKFTQGGTAQTKFSVAVNERHKVGDEWKERVEWVNCVMWGKRAEAVGKLLTKGSRVTVLGSLRTSSWEDKEGNKRSKTEVNVNEIVLMGGNGGERSQREDGGAREPEPSGDFGDNDIPF